MHPADVAAAATRLRAATVSLLDGLSDEELGVEALPGWSVADVFRHLAHSDRGSVLVGHLRHFLPGRDLDAFEDVNDVAVDELSSLTREELRDELQRWGRRLQTVMRATPARLGRVRVPSAFGRLPIVWFGALRCYDEWVHQADIAAALGHPPPHMDPATAEVLAELHLRALPAGPLRAIGRRPGVVGIAFRDAPDVAEWRFDLSRRQYGPRVSRTETAAIVTDVPTFCLLAGARRTWADLEAEGRLTVEGDRDAAAAVLDVVRVV